MFEAPWTYPEKINIDQQINELKRERALRVGVYTKMVRSKSLKQSAAEYQMGALDQATETLEWVKANRKLILRAMELEGTGA